MEIGIQLYSVRDGMENDFEGTLKKISELGYTSVEFAGFYGRTPEQINALLKENNLTISGTHSSLEDLINNYDETVAFHKAIGNKNYIIAWYDLDNQEKLDTFIAKVNEMQPRLAKDGINLGYHNHHHEFLSNADGSVIYEQLLYRTNLMIEIDTYWAFVGMKNPLALIERVGDRIHFLHIKDGDAEGNGTPLGLGMAPVKDVVKAGLERGIPLVVESETCNPSGLDEAQICIEYLKSI